MFGTIRKHQTWLWAVIITLTVISFVIYFSPYSRMNSGGRRGPINLGSINGERITEEQFVNARQEVRLQYFFLINHMRGWPDEEAKSMGFDPDKEAYKWLLLVQKMEQLGIHISSDQVAQIARDFLRPLERSGPVPIDMFVSRVLEPAGLQLDDFERFCRHYLGIQELISVVGLGGRLVTPEEARAMYERQNQKLATEAVFFPATNYMANITVTSAALAQFYTNEMANYRIPERVQVKYVGFGISNFLAQAESELKTNLTSLVETNFQQLGTNYVRYGKTPEEAKATIREKLIRFQALENARRQARDFANKLLDKEHVVPGDLEALASASGLKVGVTAPFDRDSEPKGLEVGPDFAKGAFSRTEEDPFAGPFVGENGVYEIGFYKRLPSENPSLEQIRERVTADYKFSQAVNMARVAGMAFYGAVTNELNTGKSFSAICLEKKYQPVTLSPFAISSTNTPPELPEELNFNLIKQIAFSTLPGNVSRFQPTSDGGMMLYVKSKVPLDEARMRMDLPAFTDKLRQQQTQDAFNLWMNREAEKGLRDTPLFQQRQPPVMGSSEAKS